MASKSDQTKQKLSKALIELLQSNPFEEVTISSLTNKANVSRSAFYNNYKNIEECLKETYYYSFLDAYQDNYSNLDYLFSDNYILDTIKLFDINTELILALNKWNLLSFITRPEVKESIDYIKNYKNDLISQYPDYFMVYSSRVFNVCLMWLYNNKKETPDQLYSIIKGIQQIEQQYRNI